MKLFLLMVILLCVSAPTWQVMGQESWSGCRTSCGNLTIKYPFGTSPECYLDERFLITCNETANKGFLGRDNLEVLDVSYEGELRVLMPLSYACYSRRHAEENMYHNVTLGGFSLSLQKNKLTAIGCDTDVSLKDQTGRFLTGCSSVCDSIDDVSGDRSCSGKGCCETAIPGGMSEFAVTLSSLGNHTYVYDFNPCSYAFIVEDGYFSFNASLDRTGLRDVTAFPVVLDWSVGDKACEAVNMCGDNSSCVSSVMRPGYICECKKGYDGNPYLRNGCKEIDECKQGNHNCAKQEYCHNTNGGFECRCPKGFVGDPTKGCTSKTKNLLGKLRRHWAVILLGTIVGVLVFLLGVCCLNQELRHLKHIRLREKFFEQNGGILLRQRLSGAQSSSDGTKIFTVEEIERATDDFHESGILGEGGQGTVYKGILPDGREVAIKRARIGDQSQVEQFINEVIVLSQLNHRNVVKLLGCCLETEVPLLIYEFVSNGTLHDRLHGTAAFESLLSWGDRLRIATETAETLSYLHSSASVPVIHRDIKSANILLDDKLSAKVSDFGASRLIPADREQITTLVQGTLGYLDPEYFKTSVLNEKNDVYSFGVVLMELVSGQRALSFTRPLNERHLVSHFDSAVTKNRLDGVLDSRAVTAENHWQLKEVARLAVTCTRVKGEERPRMKEVASELDGLRVMARHKCVARHSREVEYLLGDQILHVEGSSNSNSGKVLGYYSI